MILTLAAVASAAWRITINVNSQPIKEVLKEVKAQSGINLIYITSDIPDRKITLHLEDATLKECLDAILKDTRVTYSVKDNNIILRREAVLSPKRVISGFVREEESGEAAIGAIVRDANSGAFTTSNSNGFYSLPVTSSEADINITLTGYTPMSIRLDSLKLDNRLDITLTSSGKLDEVIIVGDKNSELTFESPVIGNLSMNRYSITSTPTLFGESDIIKSLQFQPGVIPGVEGFAGLQVHGGSDDQNMYLLDNVPLYQVNHLAGMLSSFNTDAINNVDFYKSSFPSRYDGRLSSIIDIRTRDGNLTRRQGSWKIGLTSGSFNIEGPIIKNRMTYTISVRRSWFDLLSIPGIAIYNAAINENKSKIVSRYAFTDFNAKTTYHFNDRSRLHLMVYYGNDFFKGGTKRKHRHDKDLEESSDISTLDWGSFIVSANWNHVYTPQLFGEISMSFSRYNSMLKRKMKYKNTFLNDLISSTTSKIHNRIDDYSLRVNYDWQLTHSHHLNFGVNYTYHVFTPYLTEFIRKVNHNTNTSTTLQYSSHPHEMNLYIDDEWHINKHWAILAGMSLSSWINPGNKDYLKLNPRVSAMYRPIPSLCVKASFTQLSQYNHQLRETALSLPTDMWIPIAGDFKPQKSRKASIGAYYNINNRYMLSMEAYYKRMYNLIDYRDDYYYYPSNTIIYEKLTVGDGKVRGIDMSVRKTFGNITGHISYSMLWNERRFEKKNNGQKFPSAYDNRHKANIVANWRINDRWEINAGWTIMSGNRITLPTKSYNPLPGTNEIIGSWENETIDYITSINNYRLPAYHRLDIGANLHVKGVNGKEGVWNFSLYNAYCNMNVIAIRKRMHAPGKGAVYEKLRMIPLIPSVSYTLKF